MTELSVSQLWCSGPEWLPLDVPFQLIDSPPMPESCSQELKSKGKPSHNLLVAEETSTVGSVMQCEDFGDLQKLLRVTAYVLRAVERFKIKRSLRANLPNTLSPQEISASELLWVTHVQRELVQQTNYNTLKKQLGLFRDKKGLWQCGG